jgi:hypothetical protein
MFRNENGEPRIGRIIGAGVLGVILLFTSLFVLTGLSQNKAEATRWGCTYGGGLLDTPGLKMTVAPGTRGGFTVFDNMRTVPSDVRDYIIDADSNAADPGATPIALPVRARDVQVGDEVLESEGVTYVLLELQAKFVFNENACVWDEKYGRGMSDLNFDTAQGQPSGWTSWLKNNMYKRIQEAARPVVKDFDWLQLATNQEVSYDGQEPDEVFDVLAREISATLTSELEASLGANFFCGPSYSFDGDVDGEFETCPRIEISITELTPQNKVLLENYEAIVANAEAQQKIESDKDRAIAQANATSEQQQAEARAASDAQVTQAEEAQRAQIAEEQRRNEVGINKAAADLAIAQAQAEVARQQAANDAIIAQGSASYCRELAAAGVSCELLEAAKQGTPIVPQIVTGDGAGTLLNIPR